MSNLYQVVPTEIVDRAGYRKSLDGSLTLVTFNSEDNIPFDSELYPVLSQSEVDEFKFNSEWYKPEEFI